MMEADIVTVQVSTSPFEVGQAGIGGFLLNSQKALSCGRGSLLFVADHFVHHITHFQTRLPA